MTLQFNICPNPEVDKLLLKHNNQPMRAVYEALKDTESIELLMAMVVDLRCGIERRVDAADKIGYFAPLYIGATPLILAIVNGRADFANALLAAGADPNAQASDGRTSLMSAACYGNLEAIEYLVSYGADINAVDNKGKTALEFAARHGPAASLIEPLEQAGANLEAVDIFDRTSLHCAAKYGIVDAIEALLKLGANQAAADHAGQTPLHCAVAGVFVAGAIEAFRCNVAAFEANLTAVDKNGRTPLHVYVRNSSSIPEGYPRPLFSDDSRIRALLTPK